MSSKASHDIGWIGLGRMGEAMAARLVKAGHSLSVWNRTASKADPLAQIGAEVVTDKAAMAHCATLFTMVSTTDDLKEILFGKEGVLTGNARPKRIVDMSSISDTGSAEIRRSLTKIGGEPAPNKPAEFDAMIVRELAENRELVKAAGIKPQ